MYQKMSLNAYRNSFLRAISVIIEIINYPFKLRENAFQVPIFKNNFGPPPSISPLAALAELPH